MKSRWINWLTTISVILFLVACGAGEDGEPVVDVGGLGSSVDSGLVPDTGQISCYYDYTLDGIYNPAEFTCLDPGSGWSPDGQDGYYLINTMLYTDNDDGMILDNVTGLTWQKCSFGQSGNDCSNGSLASYAWSTAKSQCANLSLNGTGWRLPTVFELTRIVNYGKSYSAIDETAFPGTGLSPYWSSTVHASVTSWAWYVSFAQGNTWVNNQSNTYYVRCVRG